MRQSVLPFRRRVALAAALVAFLSGSGVLGPLLAGCSGGSSGSTSGKRVLLNLGYRPDSSISSGFTASSGWSIKLSKAAVSLGGLYFFDGAPAFVDNRLPRRRSGPVGTPEWLGLREAFAHPGHYQAGNALGQFEQAFSLDLLAGAQTLGEGDGVTGTYRSAQVKLGQNPTGAAAALLGGHVAVAEGVATKASATVHFAVFADYADVVAKTNAEADGCVFEEARVDAQSTVSLTVKPAVWFQLVDFTGLEAGTAQVPTVIAAGTRAKAGFVEGVLQMSAYVFSKVD